MSMLEHILKVQAYSLAEFEMLEGPPFPGGDLDIETPFSIAMPGGLSTTYISTQGRSTAPDDTPANTVIRGGYDGKLNYAINLFTGTYPASGHASTEGQFSIVDTGTLDALASQLIDGALIDVLRGVYKTPVAGYETIARMAGAGITYGVGGKSISTRDLGWLLNSPLHDVRFAGTGGYEGPTELANVHRPVTFGTVSKVPGVLIDEARQIRQVSFTPVQAIPAVQIGGAEVTASGVDYLSFEALADAKDALAIANGTFATCLAQGLHALGGTATRQVTATVQGDNTLIDAIGYVSTRAAIARRIATGYGPLRFVAADLDVTSFTAMDAAFPDPVGWYWDGEISKAEALDEVLKGILGVWYVTLLGKLTVWWLREPPAVADYVLTMPQRGQARGDADIIGAPEMITRATAPRQRTDLGWGRNYAPQTQDQLAGSVSPLIWALPSQKVSRVASWIARVAPTSPAAVVETGYPDEATTTAECIRQQALLGVQRVPWRMRTSFPVGTPIIGKSVEVRGWDRLGMAGKVCWCIGAEPVDGRLTLTLWS